MEIDPTVNPSVKDGVDWTELTGIPAGLADGIDNGLASESDPTVPANLKDGVAWNEVANIPAGFADGVDNVGLTAETDPTVPANLKDGVAWNEVANIPAGFTDGVDNVGLTAETDPTVPANLKDGVAWNEISGIPTSLLDGDQAGIASESDPQVGSNTTNRVPKWDGSALVSSSAINENASGNVGIGTASPQSKLDVAGDTKVSGVLTSGKIQVVDVVTEGSSCTPNGLLARDTNGLILSCQSGVWAKASGSGSGLGIGQTWTNFTGSRVLHATYTNSTDKPIQVIVAGIGHGQGVYATVNGVSFTIMSGYSGLTYMTGSFIVPTGATYAVVPSVSYSVNSWFELR
jgi:hypothetical protein